MTEIKLNVKFTQGEIVYVRTDPEQFERLIIGWQVTANSVVYITSFCNTTSNFYAMELSRQPNMLMRMNSAGNVN